MSERVADKMGALGIIAIAAACTLAYSMWGATVLRAEHQAGFATDNPQTQLARAK